MDDVDHDRISVTARRDENCTDQKSDCTILQDWVARRTGNMNRSGDGGAIQANDG